MNVRLEGLRSFQAEVKDAILDDSRAHVHTVWTHNPIPEPTCLYIALHSPYSRDIS